MNIIQFLLSLFCIVGMSAGQILLKLGATHFVTDLRNGDILNAITNKYVISGLALYSCIVFLWIFLLNMVPLKIAYPTQALAFVVVPILSWLIIGESLEVNTFIGALLIILGVFICVWR